MGANDLHISDGETATAEANIYVLANGAKGVGFYKLADGKKVPAGKAYLEIVSSAPEFIAINGAEATGIKAVENSTIANGVYYNLAGQRVAQPTKGLYIVNGKKVVIK